MTEVLQDPQETQESAKNAKSKSQSLEEKIAIQREKLRKLEEEKKEIDRKERERNEKAAIELLRSEKMLALGIEQWQQALPTLRKLFKITA